MFRSLLAAVVFFQEFAASPTLIYTFPSRDTYIEVGSNLTVYCCYNGPEKSFDYSKLLSFSLGSKTILSTAVNNTAIKAVITNATQGNFTFICHTNEALYSAVYFTIIAGYPPPKPLEVTCFAEDIKNLVCQYLLPEDKNVELYKALWVLIFSIRLFHNLSVRARCFRDACNLICPHCSCSCPITDAGSTKPTTRGRCVIEPLGTCFFLYQTYDFQLTGENVFGVYRKNFSVLTNESIVKLSALRDVKIFPTSYSLNLTGKLPDVYLEVWGPVQYKLIYKSQWSNQSNEMTLESIESTMLNIRNLIPYTEYEVTLVYKLVESSVWSNAMKMKSRTLQAAPSKGPIVTPGAYHISHTGTVTIYWKNVPKKYRNGIIRFFTVKVSGDHTLKIEKKNDSLNAMIKTSGFQDSSWITVTASTIRGDSPASKIYIVRGDRALPKPAGVVSERMTGNNVLVSWKLPEESRVLNTTVFWCLKDYATVSCKEYLDWVSLPAGSAEYLVSLDRDPHEFRFAVSFNSLESSSGLMFTECDFNYNQTAAKPKEPELSKAKNGIGFTLIRWPSMSCRQLRGKPLMYQIAYTDFSHVCFVKNVTAVGRFPEQSQVEVTGLEPFTLYAVCVCVVTRRGTLCGDPSFIKTEETAPGTSPRNLTSGNVTASTVRLTWEPPVEPNGNITHYIVEKDSSLDGDSSSNANEVKNCLKHKETGGKLGEMPWLKMCPDVNVAEALRISSPPERSEHRQVGNVTEQVIRKLLAFTNYTLNAEACNSAGCSPKSPPVQIKTEISAPSVVRNIVVIAKTRNELLIKWESPEEPNGPISYYNLVLNRNKGIRINGSVHSYLKNISCTDGPKDVQISIRAVTTDGIKDYFGIYGSSMTTSICMPLETVINNKMVITYAIIFGGILGFLICLVNIACCCKRILFEQTDIIIPPLSTAGMISTHCSTEEFNLSNVIIKTPQEKTDNHNGDGESEDEDTDSITFDQYSITCQSYPESITSYVQCQNSL